MDDQFLNHKAFSMMELSLGLCVAAMFIAVIVPWANSFLAYGKQSQVNSNLKAIGQASNDYYMRFGQWPSQISDLKPDFLNAATDLSGYILTPQNNLLIISSDTDSWTVLKPSELANFL